MDTDEVEKKISLLSKNLPKNKKSNLDDMSMFYKFAFKKNITIRIIKTIIYVIIFFIILPPFLWPLSGPVTSKFLFRIKPDSNILNIEIHHGIDIGANLNTNISSTALGKVETIGHSKELGNYIVINHLFWFKTIYAHLNIISVKENQIVFPGLTKIGLVGMTGRATGPHLHFGVFFFDIALSPETLLVFHTIRRSLAGF